MTIAQWAFIEHEISNTFDEICRKESRKLATEVEVLQVDQIFAKKPALISDMYDFPEVSRNDELPMKNNIFLTAWGDETDDSTSAPLVRPFTGTALQVRPPLSPSPYRGTQSASSRRHRKLSEKEKKPVVVVDEPSMCSSEFLNVDIPVFDVSPIVSPKPGSAFSRAVSSRSRWREVGDGLLSRQECLPVLSTAEASPVKAGAGRTARSVDVGTAIQVRKGVPPAKGASRNVDLMTAVRKSAGVSFARGTCEVAGHVALGEHVQFVVAGMRPPSEIKAVTPVVPRRPKLPQPVPPPPSSPHHSKVAADVVSISDSINADDEASIQTAVEAPEAASVGERKVAPAASKVDEAVTADDEGNKTRNNVIILIESGRLMQVNNNIYICSHCALTNSLIYSYISPRSCCNWI